MFYLSSSNPVKQNNHCLAKIANRRYFPAMSAAFTRRTLLATAAASLAAPGHAAPLRPLRFVPAGAVARPDPALANPVARAQTNMIWDMLYGQTAAGLATPQMVAGHDVSQDELTWRFRLRSGLRFHDGSKVRAADCVASIQRWAKRRAFGERLLRQTEQIRALDDNTFEIRLTKPFPLMLTALGGDICVVLPERLALGDPQAPPDEIIGSGPFRYAPGADGQPGFDRFPAYRPAQGPAEFTSGGKQANVDRVDWLALTDPAGIAAALQRGDIDWWHDPLVELLPSLRAAPGVRVSVGDPTGVMPILCFNHTQAPFNNPRLRRAILLAVDQDEFLQAAMGSEPEMTRAGIGVFTPGQPFANDAGLDVLTSPRDIDLVRKLVVQSGYRGEPVVLLSPSDIPRIQALTQVANDMFERIGLKVDYISLEWQALIQRRTSKAPASAGGWGAFCTSYSGLATASPATHLPLRATGEQAVTGWPTSRRLESLREDWFDATDLVSQQTICRAIQRVVWEDVPYIPLGQWFTPTATRADLAGIVRAPFPVFWGVERSK